MGIAARNLPSSSAPVLTSAAEGYKRWAAVYDRLPNPLLAREERYLLPLLGDLRQKRIVDLACGTGRWLEKLASQGSQFYVGIDCSGAMLDVAAGKQRIWDRLTRGTCERLPFVNEAFDLAICSFAMGHISDLDIFAGEVWRVSRAGADLFITDLHPEAYDRGWRVGFRDQQSAVEIEVFARQARETVDAFSSYGFTCMRQESLRLEAPEEIIFARAGKRERFASASAVPAIIAFHFRRSADTVEFWET